MKVTFKKTIGFLHLWLGLISGLVLFVVCITAAIWSFSPEIESLTEPYQHVKQENKPYLPVSTLQAIAKKQLPNKKLQSVNFQGKDKSAIAYYYDADYFFASYINPYNGQVLKVRNENKSFFRVILLGHYSLWMGTFGGQVVKWATLIFAIMLISGIVLWWPRNKAARKQRFKIKLGTSPKRLNYDLHNVLGFYAAWVIIFSALTGIVWMFDWAAKAEYWIGSGGKTQVVAPDPLSIKKPLAKAAANTAIDSLFNITWAKYSSAEGASVQFANTDSAAIEFSFYPCVGAYYNSNNLYFNQYSLQEIPVKVWGKYADANGGEKLTRMNYDIHIGNILGLPGRIAMFLSALICASLPITGFYIWWGRRKKQKKAAPAKRAVALVARQIQ